MNAQHGGAHPDTPHPSLEDSVDLSTLDQGNIRGRAPHVEGQGPGVARSGRHPGRGDDPARRPGKQCVGATKALGVGEATR